MDSTFFVRPAGRSLFWDPPCGGADVERDLLVNRSFRPPGLPRAVLGPTTIYRNRRLCCKNVLRSLQVRWLMLSNPRGIMPKAAWIEIVSADDDVVGGELLSWANLNDLWDENRIILDNYSVVRDVLEHCSSAVVEKEEWDAGAPGRSGLWHRISTNDPDVLKTELRERIEELLLPRPVALPRVVHGRKLHRRFQR